MDSNLIEKYKNDLMRLYNARASTRAVPVSAPAEAPPKRAENTAAEQNYTAANNSSGGAAQGAQTRQGNAPSQRSEAPGAQSFPAPTVVTAPTRGNTLSETGRLIAIVTTLRGIYPVPGARVTVFTGAPDRMNIIDSGITDESGRSKIFELPAPSRGISLDSESTELPYTLYNLKVEADGYADNIHMNIPIFRGVTSLQKSDMILLSAAGDSDSFVYNEAMRYNL